MCQRTNDQYTNIKLLSVYIYCIYDNIINAIKHQEDSKLSSEVSEEEKCIAVR